MKIIKGIYDTLNEDVIAGMIIFPIMIGIVLLLALICGMVTYFLIGIAFPEYISFGWHWWRFIALGFFVLIF